MRPEMDRAAAHKRDNHFLTFLADTLSNRQCIGCLACSHGTWRMGVAYSVV